jgi:23S rRNA (guanosine2251-2'-O)-methyltransferase
MARPGDCLDLMVSSARRPSTSLAELLALAAAAGLEPLVVPSERLDRLGPRHQGLALMARPRRQPPLAELLASRPSPAPALILALGNVEDPHNFGALMRSAAAFGAQGLVVPRDRSAPLSPAARSAAAGGAEILPLVRVVNLKRALGEMKKAGFWVVAAEAGQGQGAGGFDYPPRSVLLLGSEGKGLGPALSSEADLWVHVDLEPGPVDSLNVSNAGAILMHGYRMAMAGRR